MNTSIEFCTSQGNYHQWIADYILVEKRIFFLTAKCLDQYWAGILNNPVLTIYFVQTLLQINYPSASIVAFKLTFPAVPLWSTLLVKAMSSPLISK